ncbi:hypothetical protein CLOSTMETH_03716 [[Clostridium] methylpentosum DSM 5476]|uniref:Uncharacterized protein n=1 Tax=[Clostridium] methylpentosum DSM 5476 TaxID=537013 RepID=C0EIM1_9FIRM|nr:hypothetical protein CLOSTMETH_03716 [[Clostridium] methylpentosum DSM 5476]
MGSTTIYLNSLVYLLFGIPLGIIITTRQKGGLLSDYKPL